MSTLSVFIPTFNRPTSLARQIESLTPQLGDTTLTIIDNASDAEIKELIPSSVRYIRNRSNIGAVANVLRCFELCETDWLWICGDDDPIFPDAIQCAYGILQEFADTCYVSTTSRIVTHSENRKTASIAHLLSIVPDIGRLFWLTGNLYNVRLLRQYLRVANYLPNAAPQMVLVLMAMNSGHKAGVTTSSIASNTYPSDPAQRWNEHEVLCYLSGLIDLPISLDERKAIARSLSETILSFDAQFMLLLNGVVQRAPGVEDLVSLYASRWSRIFAVLENYENLQYLVMRLRLLRDYDECCRTLQMLGLQGIRSVEIPPRFQRL